MFQKEDQKASKKNRPIIQEKKNQAIRQDTMQ
jgi:hypothetical protein